MLPPNILVVEDTPLVAKFFRLALERVGGFRCVHTEDVAEMIRLVQSGEVDAAVLDVSLKGSEWQGKPIDGLQLTRLLKAQSAKPLPVLLATAHANAGDREQFLSESGAEDYIAKPIDSANVLLDKIRKLLGEV